MFVFYIVLSEKFGANIGPNSQLTHHTLVKTSTQHHSATAHPQPRTVTIKVSQHLWRSCQGEKSTTISLGDIWGIA